MHGENMAVNVKHYSVLSFQTLLVILGKWATTNQRVFFLEDLLLNFAVWINLKPNTDNLVVFAHGNLRLGSASLRHVYQGFIIWLSKTVLRKHAW